MKYLFLVLNLLYIFSAFAFTPVNIFETYDHPKFNKFKTITANKLANFTSQPELSAYKTKALFYPFGGPDIVYPLMLFPEAQSYLLIGLEPIGLLEENVNIPENLNYQLDSLFRRSFFITSEMNKLISNKQGILPLFLAQIKLMEGSIRNIEYIEHTFGTVLIITFIYKFEEKKLFYIQANIVNKNLNVNLLKFIKNNDLFDTCMLKASSYSLHQHIFSQLRDFIIENANLILQDDSGIPLKYFPKDFKISLYGNYIKPYGKEWAGYFQQNLYNMYQGINPKIKIPFCYGYGCGRSSAAIILARRGAGDR